MARYKFYTADVFTNAIFGGNQLAVFPLEDPRHTKRLRIFTPGTVLPFAGHPTIGTAHVLAAIGEILLEEATTKVDGRAGL